MLTPSGVSVVDAARQVVEVVVDDLQTLRRVRLAGDRLQVPEGFTCYEIHVRRLEGGGLEPGALERWCAEDPVLNGVVEDADRVGETRGALEFLRGQGHSSGAGHEDRDRGHEVCARRVWTGLGEAQRAVVEVLVGRNGGCVALALALAAGGIDAREYASGVWRVRQRTDEDFRAGDAPGQFEYFEEMRRDAWKVGRYLNAHLDELEVLIGGGESDTVEFKATLRKNLFTGEKDPAILNASLKTIASFLNTEGGTLAIGVTDDGSPKEDIVALDELETEDKYLRHLFSKMKETFGEATAAGVTAGFERLGGTPVCVVRCSKSKVPVFAVVRKDAEEFFVRNGPSTLSLSIRAAIGYIRQRFPDYGG